MAWLRGHFLVASPHLPDSNFARSVVLLVEHQADGALGVIVNRLTAVPLEQFWKRLSQEATAAPADQFLSLGGPVEGQAMCLHTHAAAAESEILPGLFLSTQVDKILKVMRYKRGSYRIFWGYAGWGPGQLEAELKVGGWLIAPATVQQVFRADPELLWQQVMWQSGERILRESLQITDFPPDPSCN